MLRVLAAPLALALAPLVAPAGPAAVTDAPPAGPDARPVVQDAPGCQFRAPRAELTDRLSPPDSTTVRIDGGIAKICYGSPSARGRAVMGDLVPHGQPWRLGANEPTTLHLTFPARVGEVRVDPGSYSLYAIPGEEAWEVVVNSTTDRWGIPINASVREHDVGSTTVEPRELDEHVESLSIDLQEAGQGAEMVIAWEHTELRVPLRHAEPSGGS